MLLLVERYDLAVLKTIIIIIISVFVTHAGAIVTKACIWILWSVETVNLCVYLRVYPCYKRKMASALIAFLASYDHGCALLCF